MPDGKGKTNRRFFTCLKESPWNQPECPGCSGSLAIKLRGVYNVIQRQRAVYRKDHEGNVIRVNNEPIIDGYADTVVILDVPSTTADMLRGKDGHYHGLTGLDLTLSYSGNSFQPWNAEPANFEAGRTPMSQEDLALSAGKHNLDDFMKPPGFQEAAQIVAQFGQIKSPFASQGQGQSPAQGTAQAAGLANGFLAGANVPQNVTGGAFGAAQAAVQPTAAQQPPLPAGPPTPEGGQVPVVGGGGQPVPVPAPAPAPAVTPAAYDPATPPQGWNLEQWHGWLRSNNLMPAATA